MRQVDARSEDLLELPAIRERLAAETSFSGGRSLALGLAPSPDPNEVARRAATTAEALALADSAAPSLAGAHDVRDGARSAARGATLEVDALADVMATAATAVDVAAAVGAGRTSAPLLAARSDTIDVDELRSLQAALAAALDGRGGLRDSASPELARARRELAVARSRAAELIRDLARRLGPHLQEGFVTERAGRPVLAVKASSRSAVPGLVHDTSGSGQTLFVEPLGVVDANNRVRELEATERHEEERVLAALSGLVGLREAVIAAAVEALADLDLALASAALSRRWRGCPVEPAHEVALEGARHPLLDPDRAVPLDLDLAGIRALVVTGPNTGGKTVALKTLGLLALLHQCGLRPPARRARLPVFDRVLADIGDEQSIAQSLSTFSGHVRRLVAILDAAGTRSLALLDEVAAGTDPVEGAALAEAILERLVARGVLVLATGHQPELKAWASRTPGAANAAVGFDPRDLAPTYELRVGEPGASHALAVAERLGLDAEVVEAARRAVGEERRTVEDLLAEAAEARVRAADALAAAESEREAGVEAAVRLAAREAELAAELERVRAGASDERARARREAEAELAGLGAELSALRAEIAAARRAEAARRSRAAELTRAGGGPPSEREESGRERDRRLGAASAAAARARTRLDDALRPPRRAGPVAVGDRVLDPELGVRGRVLSVSGSTAEVQGPGARLRLPADRLVPDPTAPDVVAEPAVRVDVALPAGAAAPEVDVRGRRWEEARAEVRERIDAASLAGLARVRVIHGKGSGALRAAVREELARHPLVERVEPAPPEEGGDGATLAVLAG
jgi:DNA mismatch repair protein MutS2